jgi:hypothetical protein
MEATTRNNVLHDLTWPWPPRALVCVWRKRRRRRRRRKKGVLLFV